MAKRNYIKAILRNRLSYINESVLRLMLKELENEEDFEDVRAISVNCSSWTNFREQFNDWCGGDY